MSTRICSVEGCSRPHSCKGLCKPHYQRWQAKGTCEPERPLRNPQGTALSFLRNIVLPFDGGECLPWPYTLNKNGHGIVKVAGKNQLVSRIVCAELYGPPPSEDHEAAHSCGKGHLACVNGGHLRWATHAENEADKIRHGTSNRGERHGMAKLSAVEVLAIREMAVPSRQIAKAFGISQTMVSKIKRGEAWAHV